MNVHLAPIFAFFVLIGGFLARDSMLSALYATAIPSVCPSVHYTGGSVKNRLEETRWMTKNHLAENNSQLLAEYWKNGWLASRVCPSVRVYPRYKY